MWIENFFNKEDRQVKDKCPICKHCFGKTYVKIERIYYCDECSVIVVFHPNEEEPKVTLKKKDSEFDVDYRPFDEDMRLHMKPLDDEDPRDRHAEGGWWA